MVEKQKEVFCKAIRKHYGRNAVFDFSQPDLKLGDFGTLENGVFSYEDNVVDFGFLSKKDLKRNPDKKIIAAEPYVHWSNGIIKTDGSALLKTDVVDADFSFKFKKDNQFLFSVMPIKTISLSNIKSIGKKLRRVYDSGEWEKNYCLVTNITITAPSKLVIGSKSGAEITTSGKVNKLQQFIDVAASLNYKSSLKTTQAQNHSSVVTSLFQLHTFKKKWGSAKWKSAEKIAGNEEIVFEVA